MYKFIRYFNQNRKKIYRTIIIIIAGLLVLRFANYMVSVDMKEKQENTPSEKNNTQNITTNTNNINTDSAITGTDGGTASIKETNILEQFIKYCNEGNTTEAYNMLSKSCQEAMYPTLKNFIDGYYNDNFNESKSYKIQRWSGSIYKVDFKSNMLHTGNFVSGGKQDYITIVREDEEYKLNINSYIGRTNLNKEVSKGNVTIQILYKDTYMNNEIYVFEVKNPNDNDIYLGDMQNTESIYLIDNNDIKYEGYINEMEEEELHIYAHTKKQVKISFSNRYITGKTYSQIVFENVIDKSTRKQSKMEIDINK